MKRGRPHTIVVDSDGSNEAAPHGKFQCRNKGCPYEHASGVWKNHGYCCNACRKGDALHTKNCTGKFKKVRKSTYTTVHNLVDHDCSSRGLPSRCEFQVLETRFDDGPHRPFTIIEYINRMFRTHAGEDLSADLTSVWRRVEGLTESTLLSQRFREVSYEDPPIIYVYRTTNVPRIYHDACIVCGKPNPDDKISNVNLDSRFFLRHPQPRSCAKAVTGLDRKVQLGLLQQPACAFIVEECILRREFMHRKYGTKDLVLSCNGATHRSFGMALLLAKLVYPRARVSVQTSRVIEKCEASDTMKKCMPQ